MPPPPTQAVGRGVVQAEDKDRLDPESGPPPCLWKPRGYGETAGTGVKIQGWVVGFLLPGPLPYLRSFLSPLPIAFP